MASSRRRWGSRRSASAGARRRWRSRSTSCRRRWATRPGRFSKKNRRSTPAAKRPRVCAPIARCAKKDASPPRPSRRRPPDSAARGSIFGHFSGHADGRTPRTHVDAKVPKGRVPPRPLRCYPADSIYPSAFVVGMRRKVAKNRSETSRFGPSPSALAGGTPPREVVQTNRSAGEQHVRRARARGRAHGRAAVLMGARHL